MISIAVLHDKICSHKKAINFFKVVFPQLNFGEVVNSKYASLLQIAILF